MYHAKRVESFSISFAVISRIPVRSSFLVWTDHHSLFWPTEFEGLEEQGNSQEFPYTCLHRPGKLRRSADIVSRCHNRLRGECPSCTLYVVPVCLKCDGPERTKIQQELLELIFICYQPIRDITNLEENNGEK